MRNLEVLWMARCCMQDLDGVSAMSNLRELYVAYNDITDVSPCNMLDQLQILDLEGFVPAPYCLMGLQVK